MQFRVPGVDRTFGRIPRHELGRTAARTVAAIAAKLADERRRVAITPMAWQDPAGAIRAAVVVCKGAIVPTPPADPSPTLPLSRAELVEHEVDGGRPLHDLDHVQRYCRHADSLYGRCADCGMTWVEQARAVGGAR